MDIGIIGAGNIGGTLGRLLVAAGHRVRFGLRKPEAAEALAAELGVSAGTVETAIAFGECIIFAGPFGVWPDLAKEHGYALAGKVVIDAANPIPERDGAVAAAVFATGMPSGVYVSSLLPGSHVAKAFNTVYWLDLRDKAHRSPPRLAMPFAADHPDATRITRQLAQDAGFDPINLGSLTVAAALEPGSAVYAMSMTAAEIVATLGIGAASEPI